ncbi:hypothetical protein OCV67_02965 [Porcipelethomonas ammoniilytica]|uniref:hypothetical protein n=1 Tax=Porcipelethomonas ammoniilytica TaxID=2981722 RepID=UPI0008220F76|nr:hypothetical protein [Porcipelethomonas ammoniilytica]MCU6718903.1 hypothetical protein [Porcipelethomonas ammoniilytica]SCI63265.1 Uncharacterised protein [uncultured Ruminococcus sp.]
MNIKNLFAVSAALAICISFTACSENNSSKKSKTSSAAESNNEMSAEIPAKITVSPKSKLTEREYKGYYIANGITTGINLHAPEGLTVTDCETFENSDGTFTCMPECVPTASKPFVISDESGKDNMNFFASAGPGQEEFKKITKESYEEEYVKGVSDYFTDVEIKDFESFEIENYPALKAVIKAEYNGETFEQTQVILDVAEYGCQSGYMYTITYTDYSGTLKEKIQDSIDSIDECNSLNIWRAYKNPEDAAAAKENGTYTIYGNVDKYKKKAVTAATYTYVTKSSRIKDVEELRKKFSITFKRRTEDENNEDDLNAVYESGGESTQTTIDMEMVERFKKQHGIE